MAPRPVVDLLAGVDGNDLLRDFVEDDDTACVPDLLGRADFAEISTTYRSSEREDDQERPPLSARRIEVPRPNGGSLVAYDLPLRDRILLHNALKAVRAVSDGMLAASVCGYRCGASDEYSHRSEYQRFRDFTAALVLQP